MKYRTFGKTGFEVSEIGFGAWAIGAHWGTQSEKDSLAALHTAIDRGVNFIETAALYGDGKSEQIIAKALKDRSERIYIATKSPPLFNGAWPPSPYCNAEERYPEKHLRENVEERLRMLEVETLDVLMLHTWTRAWNNNPYPLEVLQKLKEEGKVRHFGLATPEHDQNSVIELMRKGLIDVVSVIYNIFEQEPAAEILPVAQECNVGIIGRVAFDESSLTGKFTKDTKFEEDDFRNAYFSGDRLSRTVDRVEKLKEEMQDTGLSLAQIALQFVLAHPGVSTVIPGMRNTWQAEANTGVSDLPPLSEEIMLKLREHAWKKAFWYMG